MRVARMVEISVLAALAMAAAGAVCAQNTGGAQVVVGISGGAGGAFSAAGLKEAPYSATRTTTRVQTLADGTTITHTSTQKEARDSEGRTYRADQMEIPADQPQITVYSVSDPAKRIIMNWFSNSRTVTVRHWPEPQKARTLPAPQNSQATAPVRPRLPRNTNSDFHVDDLGTQDINGIQAHGRWITRVIPAGSEGNDQPITVTTESWTSSELHIDVLMSTDDPRFGNTRIELSDIDLNEPAPSLFQVPDGYEVQEMEPVRPRAEGANPQ